MDRLTQLFADRNQTYSPGLVENRDTLGNSVTVNDPGFNVQPRVGGLAEAAVARHPFYSDTLASTTTAVEAGQVNGVSATGLSLNVSTSGTRYIYLDVTHTQDVSADGYVLGFSGGHNNITCACATGSSVPADTSTHLYRQIAKYVDGVKTEQTIISSMEVVIRDDGSGTSTANAIWGQS